MNRRAVLLRNSSSPVQQQMMANPSFWWNPMNSTMRSSASAPSPQHPAPNYSNIFPHQLLHTTTHNSSSPASSSCPMPSWHFADCNSQEQQLPESWSQLLLGGFVSEDKIALPNFQAKRLENWGDQQVLEHQSPNNSSALDVKQEHVASNYMYTHASEEFHGGSKSVVWPTTSAPPPPPPPLTTVVSSPKSCITTFNNNLLDFSNKKSDGNKHQTLDRSCESNSSATGGAQKKAKVQSSSAQSTTFKVRKEKLGDRITALHQLVSPFGKTDTASVLAEAIGYIRFLQSQIEALSLPYLGNGSGNMRQQPSVQRERNCMFPEGPGQEMTDHEEPKKDLRSRGLCLVPIQCTVQVGNENGADYWAPALGAGYP